MAAIPVNKSFDAAETTISKLDLSGGPHTFSFVNYKQVLVIENSEVAQITVNLIGDGVTVANCSGLDPINISAGYDVVVPADTTVTLYTSTRRDYMGADGNNVTATITGATGLSLGWLQEQ